MLDREENQTIEHVLTRPVNRRTLLGRTAALGAAASLGVATHPNSALAGAGRFTRAADGVFQVAGGEAVIAAVGEPSFDPYFVNNELRDVSAHIFQALFDWRGADPYTINPALAETWEETDTTLTVTLRKGVLFHNGREVVAQDVLDNLDRAKDESLGNNLSPIFLPTVASAEAVDQYTVKITYATVYPTKLEDLVYLFLIPKEAMADVATNPIGAGPFKFGSYTPGDKLELVKFDDYYEADKPYLDKVTVKIIPDLQSQLANLSAGAVDLVSSIPLSDIPNLETDTSLQLVKYPVGGVWQCILLNCKQAPFDNKLVRQALNYTVDREKINQFAYFGQLKTTHTRYLPEISWFNPEAEAYYSYDLEKAKALLVDAGFPDGFETKVTVSSGILGSKEMAQVWVQDLDQVGIKAEIEEKDQALFFDDYFAGKFGIQAYTLGGGTVDPAIDYAANSPLRIENNTCGIETLDFFAEYESLLKAGSSTIDPAVRKTTYDRVQLLSTEQGWVIDLAFTQDALALSTRIKGYQTDITQVTNMTGVWIEE